MKKFNHSEFIGWSGFVIAILGVALMVCGSNVQSDPVGWLGLGVGAIGAYMLVAYAVTK